MLEMMPGSLIDKTNNNLSDLACAHSTIGQKTDPEKEIMMNVTEEMEIPVISSNLEINSAQETIDCQIVSQETSECNVPESTNISSNNSIINMKNNSTNKLSLKVIQNKINCKKEKKLLSFLEKHNITEKDLMSKLKHFKRQTKDRRRPNCVLSLKLNRYYFKINKPKWSNRMATEKKSEVINTYIKKQKQSKLKEQLEATEKMKNESSSKNSQDELELNTNSEKNESLEKIISDFQADDDIRIKIKEQLELLRQNRKQVTKPVENEPEISISSKETTVDTKDTVIIQESENNLKPVSAKLDDVLLSQGEVGLSIVSVVGGYFSDEESRHEDQHVKKAAVDTEKLIEETRNEYSTQIIKGVSMTDILLKRELKTITNLSGMHLIKPTKTNDIRKIKGWRTKQFAAICSPEKVNMEDKLSTIEDQEKLEEVSQKKKSNEDNLATNSIDNPLPSTSSGYCEPEAKNAIQTTSSVKLDNILTQGENTDIEKNTKSAFVSDMLDSYLTNHAKLKISYEVPKLVAEEAISKPISEMPIGKNDYLTVVNKSSSYKKKNTNSKVLKPKTLAEKRRMLEQDRQNQLLHDMETNESIYKKQLEYCEKRNNNEIVKDIRENIMAKDAPFSRHCWNMVTKPDEDARQFVIVNGNKIRILGSAGGKDIIVPNEITRSATCNKENKHNKLHLLNSTAQHVYYKPGPLSRKHKLMKRNKNSENWECHVLKMPKIKLQVYPEQGKRLPLLAEKYLQLYRGEKGFISDELAKFAVSAVRCEEYVKTKFEFDIPYHNGQNKLLVRKQMYKNTSHDRIKAEIKEGTVLPIPIIKKEFSNINVEDSIKDIMSAMLNCIENQELDKVIIKEDPDNLSGKNDKNVDRPPSPIDPRVQAIIKRPNAKRSKTTLELRRLNVQVIEVDVKEEENELEVCTKDFCKLGCVCKSLRGATSLVPEHCGRESCMMECSCSFGNSQRGHHSITLPAGTDLLSASTVVRLQDEVKRNLAKEEREFAQTVIKANNQTIMVGGGARERQRRVPKVPKKYSNYVQKNKSLSYDKMISVGLLEDDDDFEKQMSKIAIQKAKEDIKKETERILEVELKKPVPIWTKNDKKSDNKTLEENECRVKLTKLKLENVVPWCMVHKLYKCHCDGKAIFESTPIKQKEEQINSNTDDLGNKNEYISYAPRFQARYVAENQSSVTVTDISDKYCARTRALATNFYQARNKSQSFKARYAKIRKQQENKIVNFEPLKQELSSSEESRKRYLGEIEINDDSTSGDEQDLLVPRKNKKVTLVNVEDILNPQNKEEKQKPKSSSNACHVVSAASFIDYERSFMGILTPSGEWLEKFHKMLNLNLNTVIRQIRLLEWATLVKRQRKGSLQMWFNNKKYNNIILTEDRKRPSRSHMNIKLFESSAVNSFRVPEIITSLFNNKLPGVATKDTETYVILVYNGISWEARGTIVLNDTSEMCKQRLGHKPTPVNILDPILQYNDKEKTKSKFAASSPNSNIVIRSTPAISVEVVNRDGSTSMANIRTNEHSGLEITKIPVANENQIVEQPMKPNINTSLGKRKETHILAPLPTGFGLSRWFMLILKNDFSVLRISFSNFHIKYTHLITAIQTAKNNQKTVRIRSQDKNTVNSNNFGVYALPNFSDRIFFGPYDNESDHGLETFRYVNGKLVNTKIYNKMRGNVEKNTTGIWYFHSSTVQNNLLLEPQNDNTSSGSDCSTEVTSAEKAVKPQIEFVDLTENDSDNEKEVKEKATPQNIDPLFNVLSADFTKKVSGDITIEPVFDNVSKFPISIEKKKNDIVIQPVNDDSARLTSVVSPQLNTSVPVLKENGMNAIRKRKSLSDLHQEPPPKKQPTLIDSIELDDDDEMPPKLEHFNAQKRRNKDSNIVKQMPALCPINNVQNLNSEAFKKRSVIYVITNIPGIGYFEIFLTDKKCMRLNINGKATMFPTINMAITWLHQLFRRHIFFMPSDLKVKFSILESTDVPEMSIFNENFLNGYHMVCEKGIFDLIRMNTDDMDNLGFNEQDSSTLLAHKCELLINRNIKILGNYLVGPEESNKLDKAKILQIAPKKIKIMESRETYLQDQKVKLRNQQAELIVKINTLLKDVPERLKKLTRDKVYSILRVNSKTNGDQKLDEINNVTSKGSVTPLPAGKVCKIVDGKVLVLDASPQNKAATQSPGGLKKKKNVAQPVSVKIKNAKTNQSAAENSKQQFEMLVPIAGLQSPVTVVGVPPQSQSPVTSLLLSNHKKSPQTQKVVDLTDE